MSEAEALMYRTVIGKLGNEHREKIVAAFALALDQRERETWRDAARVVENLDRCDDENGPTGCSEIHYTISQGRVKDAARSALLSEAERRGMKIEEKKV